MIAKEADRRHLNSVLNRPPVIGFFLIIQVPDASDMRSMALDFSPVDGFMLGFESAEHMVRMVLDDIVLDGAAVGAAFGARFYVYACHDDLSPSVTMADLGLLTGPKSSIRRSYKGSQRP
jgi:hypothetical protein